jgi:hypothetical protein
MVLFNRKVLLKILVWTFATGCLPAGATSARQAQSTPPQQSQSHSQQPPPNPARSLTFMGIVVRRAHNYVLRDEAGSSYRLDSPQRVRRFEGKSVKVTGRVYADSRTLHVDSIQPA